MLEIRRQALHLVLFSLCAFFILYLPFQASFAIVCACLLLGFVFAAAILANVERFLPKKLRVLSYLAKTAERSSEKIYKKIPFYGSIIGLAGIAVSMAILGSKAYVPILILAWGDSASTVVGVYFGKHKFFKGRSAEGSLGFFLMALIPLFILTSISDAKVVLLAAAATLVEIVSPIDDNFTIPVSVSVLMKLFA